MESFSTCFWNENGTDFSGFEALCRKLKVGKQMWKEYIEFLRHRAHAQEMYGKALVKLSKLCGGKDEAGGLRQAWDELSARTELVGLDNINLANDLIKEVNSLQEKLEIDQQKRRHAQSEILKTQICRKTALKKVSELKRNYFHKSKQSEQIGQALLAEMGKANIHPKDIDKLKTKHTKSLDSVYEADTTYKESLNALEEQRQQWEKETINVCQLFEELEKHRMKVLRDSFWQTSNLFSTHLTKEDDNQEAIRNILEKLDLNQDIQLFIKENKTGQHKPKPMIYEPYRSDSYEPNTTSVVVAQPEKEEPIYAVVNKNANTKKPVGAPLEINVSKIISNVQENVNSHRDIPESTSVENDLYEASVDTFEEFAWRVLEDYQAQSSFEISLAKDEYVKVTNQTHREWWQIKKQSGEMGYFPSEKLEYGAHTDVV